METRKDMLFELKHKEKKISDIVRFLNIRCDDTPNYSLLIGAGCSVTSGIKSGSQLIDIWKKEIIENVDDYDKDSNIENYLEKQNWYDERNPYYSLFEKRYDLQRQRRAFVENEVSRGNPSIGYAYLVKLIENNYFNAIFTTNFDDLLNESFYRFSNVRPVVCAHDSAITSITVTSKRPKIIKLHGDYLFEDIKSTLRETESLEGNMKNKFIEFSKDYGLIVVGYAGNDRSIMDILTFLLKKEEFFKNGIYWCVRNGDENISDNLRKLLWKDRVYYVKIDGFDELMAELNKHLNKGVLPIDNAILSSEHQLNLIKSLTSNEYVAQSSSKIIQDDSKKLRKMVSHNIVEDFFKHIDVKKEKKDKTKRKNNLIELNDNEKKILNKIKILLMEDEYIQADNLINEQKINKLEKSIFKIELLEMKRSILRFLNKENTDEYKETIDSLIEIRPYAQMYYLDAVECLSDIKLQIQYLNKIIELFPKDYSLYLKKADILSDHYNNVINKEDAIVTSDEITGCYLKSIELDGSIMNRAWVDLSRWYLSLYENDLNVKEEKINNLLTTYRQQNKFHPNYLRVYYLSNKNKDEDIEEVLREGYVFAQQADITWWVEANLLILIDCLIDKQQIDKIRELMDKFETEYIPSSDYLVKKASFFVSHLDRIPEAIRILEDLDEDNPSRNNLLIKLYAIEKDEFKAKLIVDKFSKIDFDLEVQYYLEFNDYKKVCELLEAHWQSNNKEISYLINYSFAKIKLGDYDTVYRELKKYYDNPRTCAPELAINYFIASFKKSNKIDENKVRNKILKNEKLYDNRVISAAYALIGDTAKALDYLAKAIKEDNMLKYAVRDWPVFDNFQNNPRYLRIVGLKSN